MGEKGDSKWKSFSLISISFPALGGSWLVLRQYPRREQEKGKREGDGCSFDHGPIPAIMYSLITIFGRRGSALPIYRMERIRSSQRCFHRSGLTNDPFRISRELGRRGREKRGFRLQFHFSFFPFEPRSTNNFFLSLVSDDISRERFSFTSPSSRGN